jgi:hypothetical protein
MGTVERVRQISRREWSVIAVAVVSVLAVGIGVLTVHNSRRLSQTVRPFYDWLSSKGFDKKHFMLAECGTIEDPSSADGKARWLADVPPALGSMPILRALGSSTCQLYRRTVTGVPTRLWQANRHFTA